MNSKRRHSRVKSLINCLGVFAFLGFFQLVWVLWVSPFPERDGLTLFWLPIESFLIFSRDAFAQPAFFKEITLSGDYPSGWIYLAIWIHFLGLSEVCLNQPYFLSLFPLIALAFYPLFREKGTPLIYGVLLLAFLPAIQISLRQFSPHGFILIFFIMALFCFRAFLVRERILSLSGYLVFAFLAVSIKHLGLFLQLNLILAYGIWWLIRKEGSPLILVYLVLPILLAWPSYGGFEVLERYLGFVLLHNGGLNSELFLGLALGIGLLAFGVVLWANQGIRHQSKRKASSVGKFSWTLFMTSLILPFVLSSLALDQGLVNWVWPVVLVLGLGIMALVIKQYDLGGVRGLFFILCSLILLNGTILYLSLIGKVIYGTLPVSVIYLFLVQPRIPESHLKGMIVAFFIFSNLFPSFHWLQEQGSEAGMRLYVNGFNHLAQNPLGWEVSDLGEIRSELGSTLGEFDLGMESQWILVDGFHSHTEQSLDLSRQLRFALPPLIRLDNLSRFELEKVIDRIRLKGKQVFVDLANSGELPVLLLASDPYAKDQKTALGDFDALLAGGSYDELNTGRIIAHACIQYLKSSGELEKSYLKLSMKAKRVDLYIHRKVGKKDSYSVSSAHMDMLEKFIEQGYGVYPESLTDRLGASQRAYLKSLKAVPSPISDGIESRPVDRSSGGLPSGGTEEEAAVVESLDSQTQVDKNDASNRANEIFLESNQYFERDPEKAMELLKKVLELDPGHLDAKKDLKILQQQPRKQI